MTCCDWPLLLPYLGQPAHCPGEPACQPSLPTQPAVARSLRSDVGVVAPDSVIKQDIKLECEVGWNQATVFWSPGEVTWGCLRQRDRVIKQLECEVGFKQRGLAVKGWCVGGHIHLI